MSDFSNFVRFIQERHAIAVKRRRGDSKPWTKDKILQNYRFCNVFREWDKVTQWIADNWREPNDGDPDLWFAMCVARFINWPETLEAIGYPVPFKPQAMLRALRLRKADGNKVFTGAYMIRSDKMPKDEYIVNKVLTQLWCNRKYLRPRVTYGLQQFYEGLLEQSGMGSFLAGQVVADVKYTHPLCAAHDWWTFAASGPGSRRGLARVLGWKVDYAWREEVWYEYFMNLKLNVDRILNLSIPLMHAQDLQNCLCEFDKYERVRLGQGRPRSNFNGGKDG